VQGCVAGSVWCAVNYGGVQGWSNSHWLAIASGSPVNTAFGVRTYAAADLGYAYPMTQQRVFASATQPIAYAASRQTGFASTGETFVTRPYQDSSRFVWIPGTRRY